MGESVLKTNAHVVDVLGNVIGRDQPLLRLDKASELVSLISKEDLLDPNTVFLDPFCKAGEILLACAYVVCTAKQEKQSNLMDVDEIHKEIFKSDRYFAISPDERHHRLSLRTFLGNENSHKEEYIKIINDGHYLSEIDGTLEKELFEQEFDKMIEFIKKTKPNSKIIAIGNPPYQENYKSNTSNTGANPIYHLFLDKMIKSGKIDEFIMVIPSRWFAGGRGKTLKTFAKDIRESGKIKKIYDFQNSKKVFPTVDIKGGVCFLHWDSKYDGKAIFINHETAEEEHVDVSKGDIIIRDKKSRSIVGKVTNKCKKFLNEEAASWNAFNLPSNYFERNAEDKKNTVICYTKRRVPKKIDRSKINKSINLIDKYKVAYPKAVKTGGVPHSTDQTFILSKGEICTETYMVLKSFNSKKEAEIFLNFVNLDLVRFLVSVKKITQDMTKDTWCLVPELDYSKNWTNKSLNGFFKLSEEEIQFLESKIKEWA